MTELATSGLIIDIPDRADSVPLNLQIRGGEVWGVLGPNGAGKTTLLHTLAGLRPPRAGRVLLDGEPLASLRRRSIARRLAVVFQERQDGFPATVLETAMIGRHPYLAPWDVETAEDVTLAREALARLDLAGLENRTVATLSGGERQRLALATALTQTPAIWLADEPTNHLDLHHQVSVMRLLADQAAAGRAVLMCLHDINLAARWCDRLLLLYPSGEACWGDAARMLVPSALERLYSQPLRTVELDGAPVFVPAETRNP
ncbi:iron complex transport system ATP-binding protein [Natronocella acetinitrilica]|uniref:Iron complex transport system ATP-binding protein n=1 Tax=Natronocella acetinitrilica TaxID=414046 RepID=A0AAE3G0N8_9GAMM|nr:ABC transporter ATP-binding protein [Natronocella acetinitrilica]MCP1673254.1 iron complex transport system ATP-binding protein [Natronocella acetinitrilica]